MLVDGYKNLPAIFTSVYSILHHVNIIEDVIKNSNLDRSKTFESLIDYVSALRHHKEVNLSMKKHNEIFLRCDEISFINANFSIPPSE